MKLNYVPGLNVILITDSLGLLKICILKKTSSKGASFAFWVKKFLRNLNGMTIRLYCTEIEIYMLIHTILSHAMLMLLT